MCVVVSTKDYIFRLYTNTHTLQVTVKTFDQFGTFLPLFFLDLIYYYTCSRLVLNIVEILLAG